MLSTGNNSTGTKKKHSKTGCAKMLVVWVLGLIPAELVFSLPSLQGQVHLGRGIDSVDNVHS